MVTRKLDEIPDDVSRCLQMAILLETSAYPKPGNVHRTANFPETRYEHFLASTVAVAPHFRRAAELGVSAHRGRKVLADVGLGKLIKDAVIDMIAWQSGRNTLLGSIILLVPLAVAAGMTYAKSDSFSLIKLRKNLKCTIEHSTPTDAIHLYDAITIARPGGLGKKPRLDVTDVASKRRILEDKVGLYEVFRISAPWDSVCSEWVNNYRITFDIGCPYLVQQLKKTKDINIATVHAFLKILSLVPDTLIMRKAGLRKAREVSTKAKKLLEAGGLATERGRRGLLRLDQELRGPTHQLNPGTTADLTSATLALAILNGYRP